MLLLEAWRCSAAFDMSIALLPGSSSRARRSARAAVALWASAALLGFASCRGSSSVEGEATAEGKATAGSPVASAVAAANPVGVSDTWPMATGDYANTRYSRLDQITASNVKTLRLAWSFSTGRTRGHEAAPLVVNDTMYVVTPFPNTVYALDLRQPGAPVKWQYDARPVPAAQGVACCDVVNRGVAHGAGKIFFNTLDGRAIALDASDGRELWNTALGDVQRGETITMAPMVVGEHVFVGNSGGEFGVRGWLTALRVDTGAIAWRAYSTGPDQDVLIGAEFRPFYPQDRGKDLGVESWPPNRWQIGGGTVWGFLAYDPALDLLYYGTANPGPWNAELRPGDNKWTAGIFARRPSTGQAVWFYQWSPHDLFDHDGVNESILLDLPLDGRQRQVLVHPERNGYVYVLDRTTGEVLSATPFAHINSTRGVDLQTGRLLRVEEKTPRFGKVIRDICPSASGAKDWPPSSYSPDTGLLYIPHNNLCEDELGLEANYIAGTPFLGTETKMYAGPGGHRGVLTAWDPIARKSPWSIEEKYPAWSGVLSTRGGVAGTGHALAKPPDDPLKIRVYGRRWWWQIEYVDPVPSKLVTTANELHVPVGRDVLLELTSRDVIHSLWIPVLHGKRDLIPGRVTTLHFKAERAGVYRGQCAEFCGLQHAHMGLVVVAESPERFGDWLERSRANADEPRDALAERGRRLFLSSTCPMCHTIEGTPARARVGPDLTHVAARSTIAAATLPSARESLREWVRDPQRFKPGTPMPAHSLTDEELDALVAYLASLE